MSDFEFNGAKSFNENFEAFLDFLRDVDDELADILRANAPALAAIVRDGDRNANARAAFNAAIAEALDALVAPDPRPEDA